jgi:hypothetical protein
MMPRIELCLPVAFFLMLGCYPVKAAVFRQMNPQFAGWSARGAAPLECPDASREKVLDVRGGQLMVQAAIQKEQVAPQESATDCWAAVARTAIGFFDAPEPSTEEWRTLYDTYGDDGVTPLQLERILKRHIPGLSAATQDRRPTLSQVALPPTDLIDVALLGGLTMMVVKNLGEWKSAPLGTCGRRAHVDQARAVGGSHVYILSTVRYRLVARSASIILDEVELFDPFPPVRRCKIAGMEIVRRLEALVHIVPVEIVSGRPPRCRPTGEKA